MFWRNWRLKTVNVIVADEDRERLLAIIGDRNHPLKHVQKAKIIFCPPSAWRFWKSRAEPASAAPPWIVVVLLAAAGTLLGAVRNF